MVPDASSEGFPQVANPRQRLVLKAFATTGQVTAACAAAAVDRTTHYYWMAHDAAYVAAFAAAQEQVNDMLEAEMRRRALGWEETLVRPDGTPYTVRKWSDTLLIFALKGAMPDKYRDSMRREDRNDISELLKAVLLELADRSQARDVTPEAEWALVPPGTRPPLPAPPGVDEEEPR